MKPSITVLVLAAAAALIVGAKSFAGPLLATPPLVGEPFDQGAGRAGEIIGTNTVRQSQPSPPARARAGNPLWAIPLDTLSATLDRPLFSPSRHPPPPAVAGAPHVPPPRQPPKPAEPERPPLTLVGTVVGETDGFGVFVDPATKAVVRLKTGGEFQGWILRSVRGREVTLEKNHLTALLSFPAPSDDRTTTSQQGTGRHPRDARRRPHGNRPPDARKK